MLLFLFLFTDSVKNKDGCVLVHCMAGISRSATVCIAFLMKHMNWDLQKAFDFLKDKRPCVAPNLSFMGQLLAFQRQLHKQNSSLNPNTDQFECSPQVYELTKKFKNLVSDHNGDERPPSCMERVNDVCHGSNNHDFTLEARKRGLKLKLHAL